MIQLFWKKVQNFNAKSELLKYAPQLQKDSHQRNASELTELIYSDKWERFFWIKQVKEEIRALAQEVESHKPKVIVEVGTNMGGSLFLFMKVADPSALIVSIDLPNGRGGGGYPTYRRPFYESFQGPDQKLHLLQVDSHAPQTLETLKSILNGQEIDFLFLDGDHSYEGIAQDFDMYAPLVRKGGLVGFHDIKPMPPEDWKQVDKFWNKIKGNYAHKEFIHPEKPWGGIGVLTQV